MKNIFFWGLFVWQVIFIMLFFDSKVHVGGDDSDYIIAGLDFLEGNAFPGWHGCLYPIILSGIIAIGGIDVVVLKIFSGLLVAANFYLFHRAIRHRVQPHVYHFALAITAFSPALAAYASTTYSEPLFMLVQSAMLLAYVLAMDQQPTGIKAPWQLLLLCFLAFCLSITRNVGLGAAIAIVAMLAIDRRWLQAAYFVVLFGVCHLALSLYKKVVWGVKGVGIEAQLSRIVYKNFYNPNAGNEDAVGFVVRFWDNSKLYLSKHLAHFLGMRWAGDEPWPWLTVTLYALFALVLVLAYKRNRLVFFMMLYTGTMLLVTFVTQQAHWDQERLVLIYLPLVAVALGFLLDNAASLPWKPVTRAARALLIIVPLLVLLQAMATPKNIFNTIAHMQGRRYAGYEPAWANYAALCEWTGRNIPATTSVLCRKPGIAGVYGERKFTGIANFHQLWPDSADALLQRQHIQLVIMDNLGLPTMSRLLTYYLQKYPLGLRMVRPQGMENPSFLLEVIRSTPQTDEDFFARVDAGIAVCPQQAYFYGLAADRYLALQRFDVAVTFYTKALEMNPTDEQQFQVLYRRGYAQLRLNRPDLAQKDVDAMRTARPNKKETWHLLWFFYAQTGKQAQATEAFKRYQAM